LVEPFQDRLPACAYPLHGVSRGLTLGLQDGARLVRAFVVARRARLGHLRVQIVEDRRQDGVLVLDRLLDVDALDAPAVVGEPVERDDHVLIDLEGVGMARDGRRARAVEPETLASLGTDGDEALAVTPFGDGDHLFGGRADGCFVVADQIGDQHHLR